MKKFEKFFKIVCSIAVLTGFTACQTATVNQNAYSSGGGYRSSGGRTYTNAVFGDQPLEPTANALANLTTWGATDATNSRGSYWLNYVGPGKPPLRQWAEPSEPVYYDRSTKKAWRKACYNAVTNAPQDEVISSSGGGMAQNNSNIQQSQSFKLEVHLPTINVNGSGPAFGGGYGGGGFYPQQQQRPQCKTVPIVDQCGRVIGQQRVPVYGPNVIRNGGGYRGGGYGGGYNGGGYGGQPGGGYSGFRAPPGAFNR